MDPILIICLVVLGIGAAVGGFFWLRGKPNPAEYLHFNCPGCGRRFRYQPRQSGHKGQCPHCSKHFVFPAGRAIKR